MGTCRRCNGLTTWGFLCGICHAVVYGMTDEQVHRALEALTPRPKREPRRIYGPDNPVRSRPVAVK